MDRMVLTDHMASMEKNLTKKKVIQVLVVGDMVRIYGDDAAPYTGHV